MQNNKCVSVLIRNINNNFSFIDICHNSTYLSCVTKYVTAEYGKLVKIIDCQLNEYNESDSSYDLNKLDSGIHAICFKNCVNIINVELCKTFFNKEYNTIKLIDKLIRIVNIKKNILLLLSNDCAICNNNNKILVDSFNSFNSFNYYDLVGVKGEKGVSDEDADNMVSIDNLNNNMILNDDINNEKNYNILKDLIEYEINDMLQKTIAKLNQSDVYDNTKPIKQYTSIIVHKTGEIMLIPYNERSYHQTIKNGGVLLNYNRNRDIHFIYGCQNIKYGINQQIDTSNLYFVINSLSKYIGLNYINYDELLTIYKLKENNDLLIKYLFDTIDITNIFDTINNLLINKDTYIFTLNIELSNMLKYYQIIIYLNNCNYINKSIDSIYKLGLANLNIINTFYKRSFNFLYYNNMPISIQIK